MSTIKEDKAKNHRSPKHDLENLDERLRQGNENTSIGPKDNVPAGEMGDRSSKSRELEEDKNHSDSRKKLIATASKSPAEEKEDERAKDRQAIAS